MRRALQAEEERQRARRDQIAAATFDASTPWPPTPNWPCPPSPARACASNSRG